jgi:hypothetical protein
MDVTSQGHISSSVQHRRSQQLDHQTNVAHVDGNILSGYQDLVTHPHPPASHLRSYAMHSGSYLRPVNAYHAPQTVTEHRDERPRHDRDQQLAECQPLNTAFPPTPGSQYAAFPERSSPTEADNMPRPNTNVQRPQSIVYEHFSNVHRTGPSLPTLVHTSMFQSTLEPRQGYREWSGNRPNTISGELNVASIYT